MTPEPQARLIYREKPGGALPAYDCTAIEPVAVTYDLESGVVYILSKFSGGYAFHRGPKERLTREGITVLAERPPHDLVVRKPNASFMVGPYGSSLITLGWTRSVLNHSVAVDAERGLNDLTWCEVDDFDFTYNEDSTLVVADRSVDLSTDWLEMLRKEAEAFESAQFQGNYPRRRFEGVNRVMTFILYSSLPATSTRQVPAWLLSRLKLAYAEYDQLWKETTAEDVRLVIIEEMLLEAMQAMLNAAGMVG